MRTQKWLALLVCAAMVIMMLPATAWAADNVSYLDASGDEQTCTTATEVTTEYLEGNSYTLSAGWYVVQGEVTAASRITVNGDVHLILADGCTLTASKGIGVSPGNSLTIYGQSAGTGTLTATGREGTNFGSAGIGGTGSANGGTITINGGTINATGGTSKYYGGAGIGGGGGYSGGSITINGGTVHATGSTTTSYNGAGIGGGGKGSGGNITITGGTVTASSNNGAGIGPGSSGSGGTVKIDGGTVLSVSGSRAYSAVPTLKEGLKVSAGTSESALAGVERTSLADATYTGNLAVKTEICSTHENTAVYIDADTHTATCKWCGNVSVEPHSLDENGQCTGCGIWRVSYLAADGSEQTAYCVAVTAETTALNTTGDSSGWYVVKGEVTASNRITVSGDVHLILADGCDLRANAGIQVQDDDNDPTTASPNALTIYGQTAGTGKLTANVTTAGDAAIGGNNMGSGGGNITINGGTIEATSTNGAGIGGGYTGGGGNITINGGTVTATSTNQGTGVGGGGSFATGGSGGNITINGGTVTATGAGGAGIGGGYGNSSGGSGGSVIITGGIVKATSGDGAGIGGGLSGYSSTVKSDGTTTISGGTVTAIGKVAFSVRPTVNTGLKTSAGALESALTSVVIADLTDATYTGNKAVKTELCTTHETITTVYKDAEHHTAACKWCGAKSEEVHNFDGNGNCVCGAFMVNYLDAAGEEQTAVCGGAITADNIGSYGTLTTGWYVVRGTVAAYSRVTVSGDAHLILADGCDFTVDGGISVNEGNSLTIYAQSTGENMGKLTAQNVADNNAAIGGDLNTSGGTITINGGVVTASSSDGAGIGGGESNYTGGSGGNITINGGTVTASSSSAAGIGGGYGDVGGDGGNITITGGTVTATSSQRSAGIGGGHGASGGAGGTIIISGGTVTASSVEGAGIGNSWNGSGGTFSTNGGSPVIYTSSISDTSDKDNWSGSVYFPLTVTGGTASGDIVTHQEKTYARMGSTVTLAATEEQTIVVWKTTDGNVTVSNNSFTMPAGPIIVTAEKCVAIVESRTGRTYNYSDFKEAFTSDYLYDGTLILMEDVTCADNLTVNDHFTLDLNGHKLDMAGYSITITGSVTTWLTIQGSKEGSTLTADSLTVGSTVYDENLGDYPSGTLYIMGGQINARIHVEDGSNAYISGGEFVNPSSNKSLISLLLRQDGEYTHWYYKTRTGTAETGYTYSNPIAQGDLNNSYTGTLYVTDHTHDGYWKLTNVTEAQHTYTCSVCGGVKTENHSKDAAGFCTECGVGMVPYVDANGNDQGERLCYSVTADYLANSGYKLESGWYVVRGDVTIGSRITVSGDVKLILADGCNFTVNGGIEVGSGKSLTIWGQSGGTGKLVSQNCDHDAGIGGTKNGACGTVIINGGNISSTGGGNAAGIGGSGNNGSGRVDGSIEIHGGTVHAIGGEYAPGIGSSPKANGSKTILISGGTVYAKGGYDAAGIGGGGSSDGGTVTITGGTVTAQGNYAPGIGGGGKYYYDSNPLGNGATVNISNAFVTANGIGGPGSNGSFSVTNSIVVSDYIKDVSKQDSWKAIIFEGDNGTVYGNQTLNTDLTITEGQTLTISENATLTIPENVTLTSNGKVFLDGTLSGTVNGNVYYLLTLQKCTARGDVATNHSKTYGKAGGIITLTPTDIPEGQMVAGWQTDDVEIENNSFTMPGNAVTVTANFGDIVATVTVGETVTNYASFMEAFAAANLAEGSTLTMLADANDVPALTVTGSFTLNLNGKTLASSEETPITVNNRSSLSVIDSSTGGKITGTGNAKITINMFGTLNFESGNISVPIYNKGTLNISGTASVKVDNTKIAVQTVEYYNAKTNISGGYLEGRNCVWASEGTVTITGGTFKALSFYNNYSFCVHTGNGKVTVNGGTFTGEAGDKVYTFNSNMAGTVQGGSFPNGVTVHSGTPLSVLKSGFAFFENQEGGKLLDGSNAITVAAKVGAHDQHTFSYSANDDNTHTATCGCGYSVIENHSLNENNTVCPCGYAAYWDLHETKYHNSTIITADYLTEKGNTLSTGWYVVKDTVTIDSRVTVSGDVKLILADGCNFTVSGGIGVNSGNSLTIYAQSTGSNMGKLKAQVTTVGSDTTAPAGIGGDSGNSAGSITINGGNITATTNSNGAGIGGGKNGSGGNITINGGMVTATGGLASAGIGGGSNGSGGTITINGGNITATGGTWAAGIGGGYKGSGGTIEINGGKVTAEGIGGGYKGSGGTITISGGTVTAKGGSSGAGIGGGYEGSGGTITISGGTVTATGSYGGAGIGGGKNGSGGTFSTGENGSAVIFANSISDKTTQDQWSGIIFEGSDGKVYGASVTPSEDFTIESGKSLLIPTGSTLTISGITAVNHGSVYVDGTLSGLSGNLYYPLTVTDGTAGGDTNTYLDKLYGKATGTINLTATNIPEGQMVAGWQTDDVEIENNSFTMPGNAVTVTANFGDIVATVTVGETVTNYASFMEAFAAANLAEGSTLTMLADANDVPALTVTGSFTLDLNGFNLTSNEETPITVNGRGSLTVIDSNTDSNTVGSITGQETGSAYKPEIQINQGGKLDFRSGEIKTIIRNFGTLSISDSAKVTVAVPKVAVENRGTLTISGGTLTGMVCVDAIEGNLTINGGTFNALYNDYNTVNSSYCVNYKGGTVSVEGGTFNCADGERVYTFNSNMAGTVQGGSFPNGVTVHSGTPLSVLKSGFAFFENQEGGKLLDGSNAITVAAKVGAHDQHTFSYSANDDNTHTATCGCGYSVIENHSLNENNTVCPCGYAAYWDLHETKYHNSTIITADYLTEKGNTLSDGWYVVKDTVTIDSRIAVSGDVKLILADGCNFTVSGGIGVNEGNSLTIYAQSTEESTMGKLMAQNVTDHNAAIGGGNGGSAGTITINGGNITATGTYGGAGIGGGVNGSSGNITISGGTVTATGNFGGAGIGGGVNISNADTGGIITITGGTVTAIGNDGGAGIGGGHDGSSGSFSTGTDGSAVIFASSISDKSKQDQWSGIIFEGSNGKVYGHQTMTEDLTITEGQTLTILENATLTIPENVTLTSNGMVFVDGTLSGTVNGNVYYLLTLQKCTASGDVATNHSKTYGKAGGIITLTPTNIPVGQALEGWTTSDAGVTVTNNAFTMPSKALTVSVSSYVNAPTYTVTIPATVELDGTATISASGVNVVSGSSLVVTLTDAQSFKLRTDEGAELSYTITKDSAPLGAGDTVLTVAGGTADSSGSVELTFSAPTTAIQHSGDYKGTVTFTITIEEGSGR